MKVIDEVLKVETPGGPVWRRYNGDGYGEKNDGSPFDGKLGIGRAWPLLTGERAHYELSAGRREEAVRLLLAVESFACDSGMIPEQVWDTADIPGRGLFLGRPAGSAMPLAWAHAEYIKLRRSLAEGRVFDTPPQTTQRYLVENVTSPFVIWRTQSPPSLHARRQDAPDRGSSAGHDSLARRGTILRRDPDARHRPWSALRRSAHGRPAIGLLDSISASCPTKALRRQNNGASRTATS